VYARARARVCVCVCDHLYIIIHEKIFIRVYTKISIPEYEREKFSLFPRKEQM